ncbi:MAG: DUF4465 domain-containing protein [Flavobacteriales bacterium]
MKTHLLSFAALCLSLTMGAQETINFESFSLPVDSFWDGSTTTKDTVLKFGGTSYFEFPNSYHPTYMFWDGGWAVSSKQDTVNGTYKNIFSSRSGAGVDGSYNYLVGQQGSTISVFPRIIDNNGAKITGFYVNNTTYAAESMKNGDMIAKKFGGNSGNDPDWFRLTIKANSYPVAKKQDTLDFYLADFRFANNDSDYILKEWTFVDLSSFGNTDSLSFHLSSSDVGSYGMNTPAFFCLDNLMYDEQSAVNEHAGFGAVKLYPNPANDLINLDFGKNISAFITVFDATGKMVYSESMNASKSTIDLAGFNSGVYMVSVTSDDFIASNIFIKQ